MGKRTIYIYVISPIDFFDGCCPLVLALESKTWSFHWEALRTLWNAMRFARYFDLEDRREGPYCCVSPSDGEVTPIVLWKQDNNGITFVAAFNEQKHLVSLEADKSVVSQAEVDARTQVLGDLPIPS